MWRGGTKAHVGHRNDNGGALVDSPACREPCQAMTSGSPRPGGVVTATFPSSRPANLPHRTGAAAPSQVSSSDWVRAVHPSFVRIVHKLDRNEEPPSGPSHKTHEFGTSTVPVGSLPDVVRALEHGGHVPEAELEPAGTPLSDVGDPVGRNAHGALSSLKSAGKHEPPRHVPSNLNLTRVRKHHGRGAHALDGQGTDGGDRIGTESTRR